MCFIGRFFISSLYVTYLSFRINYPVAIVSCSSLDPPLQCLQFMLAFTLNAVNHDPHPIPRSPFPSPDWRVPVLKPRADLVRPPNPAPTSRSRDCLAEPQVHCYLTCTLGKVPYCPSKSVVIYLSCLLYISILN